ncbi:hypothetical protein ACSBR2_041546 [Camellia fascicularis]
MASSLILPAAAAATLVADACCGCCCCCNVAVRRIFPGRCVPISAREITQNELHMVHSLEHIESVELTSRIFSRLDLFNKDWILLSSIHFRP